MEQTKKTRGAWVIRMKGSNAVQGNGAKRSPASSDTIPHCNGQRNTTDRGEE